MRNIYILAGVGIVLLIGLGVIALIYSRPGLDEQLLAAIEKTDDVYAYTQIDTTDVIVSGRHLTIHGIYENDAPNRRYTSSATTSVLIPGDGEHVFNLTNISIGDTVYTRLLTSSPLLKSQMPLDDSWHHFTKDSLPSSLENIAVIGPILDHLLLFQNSGSLLQKAGESMSREVDGVSYTLFPVQLGHAEDIGGTLATLAQRAGSGIIGVWVGEGGTIDMITIENTDFRSTTTITQINMPSLVLPPPTE